MPAAIAVPAIATAIAGGAAAGASIYGAHKQGQASQRASAVQSASDSAALDFQRSTEAERRREWDLQQGQAQAAWTAEQARRAPYRQAGQNALISLSQMAGLQVPTTAVAQPSAAPPPGWDPNGGVGGFAPGMPNGGMTPPNSPYAPMAATMGGPPPRKVFAPQSYDVNASMPGRAAGGPVNPNQPYVVGERGPEVIVPQSAGMVMPNTGAPPLGQPSMTPQSVTAAYQQAFGRPPDARELASELENANKYSAGGIQNQIARRTTNTPNTGDYGTANWNAMPTRVGGFAPGMPSGGMVPMTSLLPPSMDPRLQRKVFTPPSYAFAGGA